MVPGPLRYPSRLLFGPTPVYIVHSRYTGSVPSSWSCNPPVRGWHSVLRACLPTGVVTGSSVNDDCTRSIERLDEGESTEVESRQDAIHVDLQGTDARQNWSGWDSRTVPWRGVPDIRQRRRKFNFRWRGPPDSSVSSLILVGWCEEGHPATKNLLQLSQG